MSGIMYKNRPYAGGGGGAGGASALSDLTDVNILSPSDGQILRYNSTSGKWENADNILPMWRVRYYDDSDNFLNREYVRDGDDALYAYQENVWSRSSGGTADPTVQDDVSEDLDLYYVSSLIAPTVSYKCAKNYSSAPFTYTFTADASGNYFVFVDSACARGSSSVSSTGTQKYYEAFEYTSEYVYVKAAVYELAIGDTITITMDKGSTSYQSYYIMSAAIVKMNTVFTTATKEAAQLNKFGQVATASASADGKKFVFGAVSYQNNVTHSVSLTDTTDGKKVEFSETDTMNMSCVAANAEYETGDTLTATASTTTTLGYNNSFALVLALS